jgi:hypothetical protein
MKGAMIAPKDWVEKAREISWSLVIKFEPRKVPIVTYQDPQIKNSRNIITDRRDFVAKFI